MVTEIRGKITVPAALWQEFKQKKAEIAALEKAVKGLEAQFPLPKITEETQGTWVVVDGNGDEQGKLAVHFHPGATIPPGWRKRLS